MLDRTEKAQCGGMCFVGSKRYVQTNNQYLPDYNPNAEDNCALYEVDNNICARAMMQTLPYKDMMLNQDISFRDLTHSR